jgi:hypothetical protein
MAAPVRTEAAPAPSGSPAAPARTEAPAAPQGPVESPLKQAIRERREALEQKAGKEQPPETSAPKPEAAAGAEAGKPPAEDAPPEHPDAEAPAREEAAPAESEAEHQGAEEGQPAPEGERPEEEAGGGEAIVVQLPAREPGARGVNGEPYEIEVGDQQTADAIRYLVNGFVRGEKVREEREAIRRQAAQIEDIRQAADIDPIGFVLEILPESSKKAAARALLTDPEVWKAVNEELGELLEDPDKLRLVRAEIQNERYQLRDRRQQAHARRRQAEAQAERVMGGIEKLVPPKMTEEQADLFIEDALRDLQAYMERQKVEVVELHDLPMILTNRLRAHGIDPMAAAGRLAQQDRSERETDGGARRTASAPTAGKGRQPKPEDFTRGAEARRRAAAIPPAGAGAGVTEQARPPKGATLKEAFKWARARIKGT